MNPFTLFFALMLAAGVALAAALWAWPRLNAFEFMPYIALFLAMGLAELLILFQGRLTGPMPLNMRAIAYLLGVGAYLAISYPLSLAAK
jgi:hypothetical protein